MAGRVAILKAFEREPNKTFSTTMLVEQLYPGQMRSIREHLQFGEKQQKRDSQLLKSKLHRQTLYHINRLVDEQALGIDRIDAHGEKIYKLAKKAVSVESKEGSFQITQHELKTHFIENELEAGIAHIYEPQSTLSRVNAFFIDCTAIEGLGQLTKYLELSLKIVNDVVCLYDFQVFFDRYTPDDFQDFIRTASILTLDEAKSICIVLDSRQARISGFMQQLAATLPKRVYAVIVCDQKSIITPDFFFCIESLKARHERIHIHYAPMHPYPLFLGKAGTYGIRPEDWHVFKTELREHIPGFVASQATITLDLKLLENKPAHEVRETIMNAAKALHSMASQQRFTYTAVSTLKQLNTQTHLFFQIANNYLRFWNYNWESSALVIESCADDLVKFSRTQETIYRACGLPFHFSLQLSSSFNKSMQGLTNRAYRKWTINTSKDLETAAFKQYLNQRLAYLRGFQNIDRFRIFRGGNQPPEEVAREVLQLGIAGFPLIAVDFKPLQGLKQLTEYFT